MTHSARETLKRIGDLVEVAVKMTVQLGEDSDLSLRGLMSALDNVYQAIDDIDTNEIHSNRLYGVKQMRKESHASS